MLPPVQHNPHNLASEDEMKASNGSSFTQVIGMDRSNDNTSFFEDMMSNSHTQTKIDFSELQTKLNSAEN